jgi:hypothetical protein
MKKDITIKNGELELWISNSAIINQNEPTTLKLSGNDNESDIELIFKFENQVETEKKVDEKLKWINDTKMEITFINFNNPLGTYSSSIWKLGEIKNRELSMYYCIRDFANTELKQFDFNFYLGKEVSNG